MLNHIEEEFNKSFHFLIEPKESFDLFFRDSIDMIENLCNEKKKNEFLNLAHDYISEEMINDIYTENEMLFIGYISDLFCTLVLINPLLMKNHIKTNLNNEVFNCWTTKEYGTNEKIVDFARKSINWFNQVKRFMRSVSSISNNDRLKHALMDYYTQFMERFVGQKDVLLNPEEMNECIYLNDQL